MIDQRFERRHHVPVADVPGLGATAEHRAVVRLSVANDSGVLFRHEVFVSGDASITLRVFCRSPSEVDELLDDFVLA
jgi:hypothetical protein